MTEYRKTFKGCFMYPDQEMRDWLEENEVTIHSPWIDGGSMAVACSTIRHQS